MNGFSLGILLSICFLLSFSENGIAEDRLKTFYKRISQPDVTYCSDKSMLLPDCKICIPGLQKGKSSNSCNEYIPSSKQIRDEIQKLVEERFGKAVNPERIFGLYPCKFPSLSSCFCI